MNKVLLTAVFMFTSPNTNTDETRWDPSQWISRPGETKVGMILLDLKDNELQSYLLLDCFI